MKISTLLLYNCFIVIVSSSAFQNGTRPIMGPYKVTVVKSEKCSNPTIPYDENPMAYFTSEVYTSGKKTLLRGNLTMVRVDPHVKLSSKCLFLEDGKYKVIYVANAVGCNGVLIRIFKLGLNVPHLKGCVPKGTYSYKNVDVNAIQQSWTKAVKYGAYIWRIQVGTRTATSICWEFHTTATPVGE